MNTQLRFEECQIYRNKDKEVFKGVPKHGTPGWVMVDSGELVEVIYSVQDGKGYWATSADYRMKKAVEKARNHRFYIMNPHHLREKIRSRSSGRTTYHMSRYMSDLI